LRGGFGAGVLSVTWASVLYFLLARCIGRLCALLPKARGAYSFVTIGMGPQYGVLVAACETVKLFWVLSALAFGIVEYFLEIVDIPHGYQYMIYAFLVTVFFILGSAGMKNLGNSQIFVTMSCIVILLFYWISVSTHLDFPKYAVPNGEWFQSWDRVLESLPFGAWFFLGFEELPLLVPHTLEGQNRSIILKKGLLYSFLTVMSSCVLTLTLASGSSPGVEDLKGEEAPLVEGM
jgi:amino acid transporter